jgi:hypoxanthine phosphoribosyltransferase
MVVIAEKAGFLRGPVVLRHKEPVLYSPTAITRPENPIPGTILIPEQQIAGRINELARDIVNNHPTSDNLMVVDLLNGASVFAADLSRAMRRNGLPEGAIYDHMRAESYSGSHSGKLKITSRPKHEELIRGRDLLIIEDIIDSGKTMSEIEKYFLKQGARSITTVALLSKPHRREVEYEADYTGFILQIDDNDPDPNHLWTWVEGYGLDTEGVNRDNPDIVIGHERPKLKKNKSNGSLATALLELFRKRPVLKEQI